MSTELTQPTAKDAFSKATTTANLITQSGPTAAMQETKHVKKKQRSMPIHPYTQRT